MTNLKCFVLRLELPEGVYHAKSFDEALSLINSSPLAEKVDQIFVTGGVDVYKVESII